MTAVVRGHGLLPMMRSVATEAARMNNDLPALYWKYLNRWVALGIIAFLALVIVFYLMVAKPM